LIFRKNAKIVAMRCHTLKPKCTKIDFGRGSATDPVERVYSAPPDPLAAFKGPNSKARKRRRREGRGALALPFL